MRRKTLLALAVLAVTLVAAPAAALGGASTHAQDDQANESNGSVAPGERLAGVVGVQDAEIDGEMRERTFGVRVAGAASDEARATVVAAEINDTEERLAELEQRRAELEQARDNGSISEGRYRAEMARVAAETRTVQRMANASENASAGIPADVLEANGVNAEAIQSLRDRAGNLSGPEVAEIARSIAGGNPGAPASGDVGPEDRRGGDDTDERDGDRGGDAANGSETDVRDGDGSANASDGGDADAAVEQARQNVVRAQESVDRARERVEDGTDAAEALDRAESNLTAAEDALAEAEAAAESGDADAALELAGDARASADAAIEHAEAAVEQSGDDQTTADGSDRGGR